MNTKPIPSLDGYYLVSDDGKVFSVARTLQVNGHSKQIKRSLKSAEKAQRTDRSGYANCTISFKGRTRHFRVHRLVMEAFDPRPNAQQLDVNHKNGIKTDNRLENLEWLTRGENLKHRYQVLKQKHSMVGKYGQEHPRAKAIIGYDANDNKVCEFKALMDAQRAGYSASKISNCLSGKRATHKGLRWAESNLLGFI